MDEAVAGRVPRRDGRRGGRPTRPRCVYVGDRLFDDIWGAHHAGMRAIHIPHSAIPIEQVGHTEGEPDAVAHQLGDVAAIVEGWS